MAKAKLTARTVATAKPGRHGDGDGLYLVVAPSGARKWVFRFTFAGKVSEAGIGGGDVTLGEARSKADEFRKAIRSGVNPVAAKREAAEAKAAKPTFGAFAGEFISARAASWRNPKSETQWRASLATYAASLTSRPIDEIDTQAVLGVLTLIWNDKPETARRIANRIELILDAARAKGLRHGDNPARLRGHLGHLLPGRRKLERGHHAAMAYADVPAFIARLRDQDAIAARALEFVILTAGRSGEVLGARWDEIDLAAKTWTLPPERMKAGREHRVPLSARAVAILESLAKVRTCDFVFPSPRGARPLSHVALQKVLARMGVQATAHGFRSSFRDWAGNETAFPREVAEASLAHRVGDATETAYRRSDALEKRRALMDAWSNYCDGERADNVILITARVR